MAATCSLQHYAERIHQENHNGTSAGECLETLQELLKPAKEPLETLDARRQQLDLVRRTILNYLLATPDAKTDQDFASLRPTLWKLLLGIEDLQVEEYLRLVRLGPSTANDKIRNDTFRTLATDEGFLRVVSEDMLARLLDAFVWHSLQASKALEFSYVQGMNVLAAPFLYVMPSELEAFEGFKSFIERDCPLYVQPTLEGVHRGSKLLDLCLEHQDRELFEHLASKGLKAELYAFPLILTFSAGTPPLQEVLKLWDFYLAYGYHLNVLCVTAQMVLNRDELLSSQSPAKLLRTFPPLNACALIRLCCEYIPTLPRALYDKLARHPWDLKLSL